MRAYGVVYAGQVTASGAPVAQAEITIYPFFTETSPVESRTMADCRGRPLQPLTASSDVSGRFVAIFTEHGGPPFHICAVVTVVPRQGDLLPDTASRSGIQLAHLEPRSDPADTAWFSVELRRR